MKLLVISDDGVASGYGRISMEVNRRLVKRGVQVMACGLAYDGLLPPNLDGDPLNYHVAALGGKPDWPGQVMAVVNAFQPDVIQVVQDMPYAQSVRNLPLDWSRFGFIITSPVDGAPIHPEWVRTMRGADAGLTISAFGVEQYRRAGVTVGLCRPGVNLNQFFPLPPEQRAAIRAKLGIAPEAFVVGMMAMNQGRKAIPQVMKAFFDFALDKPTARLLLDMDPTSPAGWDLPALCQQYGWDAGKIIFRGDAQRAGAVDLRERYNSLDVHVVLAFREGFGLPLPEAMACGVVSAASDWCSGPEVVDDGRGVLVKTLDYFMPSTWGGALDRLPDVGHLAEQLAWLHDHPDEKRAMAARGMAWAREQSWDKAADAAQMAIETAARKHQPRPVENYLPLSAPEKPIIRTDGLQPVSLMERQ